MGLFSSKKKKIVGTSVTRVIEDDDLPVPFQSTVISAVMKNDSIADSIIDELINGRVASFNKVFNYAKSGNYIYGLPNETISEAVGSRAAVLDVLTSLENEGVVTNYYRLLPLNYLHYVYQRLTQDYGYDGASNELATLSSGKGYPVYLKTLHIYLALSHAEYVETALQVWDDHPETRYSPSGVPGTLSPLFTFGSATESISVTVEWEVPGTPYTLPALSNPVILESNYTPPDLSTPVVLQSTEESQILTESLSVPMPVIGEDVLYHQISYRPGTSQEEKYWTYEHGKGTYPSIDSGAISDIQTSSGYMPFTFFISNGFDLSSDGRESTPEYIGAKRFLGLLGIDFKEIGENLQENPDISDVKQAAMIFAVPMDSDDPDELEYLFHHFKHLYDVSTPLPDTALQDPTPNYSIDFSDSDFRLELDYAGITYKTFTGSIGAVETYKGETERVTYSYEVVGSDGNTTTKLGEYKTRKIQRQINATTYEEYAIVDPRLVYYVEGDRAVYVQLDDEEGRLLLPLNKNIMSRFKYVNRERLYLRSMHFIFNSLQVVKVKWYQTGIFKAFLVAIAIVITIVSAGAGIASLSTALGISQIAAAVLYVVIAVAVSYSFKLVIRELGLENSWIAVAVAIAVAAALGYSGETIAGFLDAKTLITMASGFASEIGTYASQLVAQYQGELQEFQLLAEQKWKELEEAKELLDTASLLDPFAFIGMEPIFVPGESPDSFYERTIHSGNIGTQVFDLVHNYVDTNLKLPTFEDSVRSTFYERDL